MFLKLSVVLLCLYSMIVALYPGDDCVIEQSSTKGKCISIYKCEHAKILLQSRNTPQTCGFKNKEPLVCCPLSSRSQEMCNFYFDLDRQVYAAAFGQPALPKEFPHMVAVGYGDADNIVWLCGGTLISKKFVLTAAHCTQSQQFGVVRWVRLGDLDLENNTEVADPRDFAVTRFITHPDYKPPLHYHDVALLEFEGDYAFGPFYKPACLNRDATLPTKDLQATGWGQIGYADEPSSHLIKVNLSVVDLQQCQKHYSGVSARRLPQGILDQYQMCAGDNSGQGRDTCPGDSGGPLHYFKRSGLPKIVNHYVVVGITSFGKLCGLGNTAGVYTRVSAYVDWIENIVWPVSEMRAIT